MATKSKIKNVAARNSTVRSSRFRSEYRRLCRPRLIIEQLEQRLPLTHDLWHSDFTPTPKTNTLMFEQNVGQFPSDVAFAGRGLEYDLFLTSKSVRIGLNQPTNEQVADDLGGNASVADLQISWDSTRVPASIDGLDRLTDGLNSVFATQPTSWQLEIPHFERVRYDEVYDGIDLEFYERDGEVEFDWIVEPGIDPSQIKMVYAGMDRLWLDQRGNLILTVGNHRIIQKAPLVYQIVAGVQQEVASRYWLGADGGVHFELAAYDANLTLVIDPVISYSTYLGGSGNDFARDVATDSAGNTYVIETTDPSGHSQAYLAKYTPDGVLDKLTTLGPEPIRNDAEYVASAGFQVEVGADDLPVVVYQTERGTGSGYKDGYPNPYYYPATVSLHIAKFTQEGETLFDIVAPVPEVQDRWAVPVHFFAVRLAIDNEGAAYTTYTAMRLYWARKEFVYDSFITKVARDGSVEFTRELFESVADIAVDAEHNIYVVMNTFRDDLPVTLGALQETYTPGLSPFFTDLWVAKFDPTASGLLAATYLGGSRPDYARALTIDADRPGFVYLVGTTESADFRQVDALQQRPTPQYGLGSDAPYDGFIVYLDLTKMELVTSTYIGGNRGDSFNDVVTDRAGNVYVVGTTNSTDFPVVSPLVATWTVGPVFTLTGIAELASDVVVAKFDRLITTLLFSTYYGGSGDDFGASIAVDASGTIHVAGTTAGEMYDILTEKKIATDNFPLRNASQTNFGGGLAHNGLFRELVTDAFVFTLQQRGTLAGRGFNVEQGREFNHVVADFVNPRQDAVASDFRATIDWGDGTSSIGNVRRRSAKGPTFLVEGLQTYKSPGAFPIAVRVDDLSPNGLDPLTNINVSNFEHSQTGGSIAIDSTRPNRLFAATTDADAESSPDGGILVAVSSDAGASWSPRLIGDANDTQLPQAKRSPDTLFDKFGNLFVAYEGADGNNIVVAWSTDGGKTFEEDHVYELVPTGSTAGSGTAQVARPKLAFDELHSRIWVMAEDLANDSIVVAGASVDGSGSVGSFDMATVPGSSGGLAGDIAAGPDGGVVVAWQTLPTSGVAKIMASVNLDGDNASGFAAPSVITTADSDGTLPLPAQREPVPLGVTLVWDNSEGPNRGRLYVAFADQASGLSSNPDSPALFVSFAVGTISSWSEPRRVSLDASFQSMFLPSLAIDPTTGVLAVGWYGTRGLLGSETSVADYFVATSTDGIKFSEAQRISNLPSNAFDPDLNEADLAIGYDEAAGIAFLNGRLYPLWSDNTDLMGENNSAPEFEVTTSIVGVAHVALAPLLVKPLPITAIKDQSFTGLVATFTDSDLALMAGNYMARIEWGDGNESDGLVTQPDGPGTPYQVTGTHTYSQLGGYPLRVKIHDNFNNRDQTSVANVTAMQGSQAEPTVAINPANPDQLFVAGVHANNQYPLGIPVAGSDDGGLTWRSGTLADGTDGLPPAIGDPQAVFDQYGNLFLTYLTPRPNRKVVVLLSTNGGEDFRLLTTFADVDSPDQPSVSVGPGTDGNGGSVWLTWERGEQPFNIIMAAGAPVFGLGAVGAFDTRLVAPLSADGAFRNFGNIAVGPNGQVLLTYTKTALDSSPQGPAQLVVHLDPDGVGGQPFGPGIVAADIHVGSHLPIPASAMRSIDAEGNLAWDLSDGDHRGRVHLVYTDSPAVGSFDTDIFGRYSDDNGLNWSEPIQINDANPNSQFLPSVAVDATSGNVGVAWYTATDASNVLTQFTATLSDDGGSSWNRIAYQVSLGDSDATDPSIDERGKKFQYGDYSFLSFVSGVLVPVWADNSVELAGNPDPRSFDLASARITVAQVTNAPLMVEAFDVMDFEGNPLTERIAAFTDPNSSGDVSQYRATINWGDGSDPSEGRIVLENDASYSIEGEHQYDKIGSFTITVKVTGPQVRGTASANAKIENAPLNLFVPELRVVREMEFTKPVATLQDDNRGSKASDFIATIEWGDGSVTMATLSLQAGSDGESGANVFNINGTHKYLSELSYTIRVSVLERETGKVLDASGTIVSGDPPLIVEPGKFLDIEALEGINTGDLVLVIFERPDDVEVPLDTSLGAYTATINWGDGRVDTNIIPFMTSEDVTVVGRHTYASAGEYYPFITLVDDSGGFFSVPLIAIVQPDVTAQISAPLPGLPYNPISDRFVGELVITNISSTDISGPLFVVIHDLPDGVTLESFTAVDGEGNPLYKFNQSKLPAGASLPPIALEFSNPNRVPINYWVQVFDGLRSQPLGGSGVVFEPNRGQANAAAAFIARGQGYSIGLSAGQVSLVLSGSATQAGAAALVELVGANLSPVGVALDPQPGVSNYFVGQTAITGVPHFGRVRYSQVYAGIDIEYYGREGLLEYDWIVRPQADPSVIAVRFGGVDGMVLDGAGNLRLQVNGGELVQRAPVAYQTVGGVRVDVTSAYDLRSDGTVGITIGVYDHSLALVIDPVLVYSTYLGGSGAERGTAVAIDAAGNTYVTGTTGSSDFFTVNPFDPELNQPDTSPFRLSFDSFVTKFDSNGLLVYSTYLGGGSSSSGFDPIFRDTIAESIAVDNAGHVWLGGSTQSLLFPTTTSAPVGFEPHSPDASGFLTELSADGSSILYSSRVRYTVDDLAVDDNGHVYAAANLSDFFPLSFAIKLDPVTNSLLYIASLGGGFANGIAVDSIGQAYVTGFTNSPSFPVKNALFPVLGTPEDSDPRFRQGTGFVVKLSSDGNTLFSTYLGSTFVVDATDIALDGSGAIYIVGSTQANNLPTPGGLDTSRGGNTDGFLIKLANDGQALLYGTYIGGSGDDRVTGVAVDAQGRTYLSGRTNSTDLPTVRAHQPRSGGSLFLNDFPDDGFAASIAADGGSFEYLTYWGGHGVDSLIGVAVDSKGNASYAGSTTSPDLLTSNAAQPRLLGFPAFVVRLLAGNAGALSLQNAPFTTVEGDTYDGLVAFFRSNGTETADQFSATIDWGDGVSSAGTIAGNFHDGFQILGNHIYPDVGAHDVFVTLRDSLGRTVTAMSSGGVTARAEGRVRYEVAIDTAALTGTQGLLSFQFNPAAIPGSPDATARITGLRLFGGVTGARTIDGDVSQVSSSQFTLRPSEVLNRLVESVTLGARIEFDLEFVGPGLSAPDFSDFADMFALQLLSADGSRSLLGADASASLLRVSLASDGTTKARSSAAAVIVAANGRATVTNGTISLTLAPFTVQEGLEFNGPVATFTDGNPLEIASEFTATIDWGDGSPITNGVVTGSAGNFTVSGTHVYQTVGSYALVVKVIEPDGLEVTRRSGRSILAADTITNNWSPSEVAPVSGDFNGDGILDLAVGPYLAITAGTGVGVGIFLGRGDGTFILSDVRTTGTNITRLVAADFNNDGRLDVAVAIVKFGETVVELLLGNGDGTLQASVPLTELKNPGTLLAADFNRDGNIDLVYTQSNSPSQNTSSSMLNVALGRGDGTFGSPMLTTIPFGIHRVAVADVNDDAAPDLVLASISSTGTTLNFYRGVGDGSFNAPITFASGLAFTYSLVVSDFDGDGHRDVAASVGTNLHIYIGNGDGTFGVPLQIPGGLGARAVAAGDFNRDGRVDLAIADRGSVTVFLNDGPGSFAGGVSYEGVASPATLLAADFDRDGYLDLATSGFSSVISVLPGLGDGTFASARRYASGLVPVDAVPIDNTPQGVFVTDVNGDSHSDAVLLFNDGPIVTQLGNGDGTFQSVVSSGSFSAIRSGNVGLGFGSGRNPVLADFNNDGQLDLVGTSQQSGVGIVFGQGNGAFPTSYVAAPGGVAVVLADFNQDGRLDMAASGNSAVNVYLARPDGTFPAFQNSAQYATGAGPQSIVTGDFNGDSRLDLAVANSSSGTVSVLLGNADGTFGAAMNITVGANPFDQPRAVRGGDFNGDGKLDLVVLRGNGSGLVLPGNGDGTFGAAIAFTIPNSNAGLDVAVGDFNADGKLDIVTASVGDLSVLLGNGDGTFKVAVKYSTGTNPFALTLGDFNQDGRPDIAAANSNFSSVIGDTVSILLGNANGTFQSALNFPTTGRNPRSIAAGDLNADGILDIAVVNQTNDTAILLGTGTGTFRPAVNYFTPSGGGVAIGDLNSDGHADLIASGKLLFGVGDGTFPNNQLFTYLPPVINIDFRTSLPTEVAAGDLNADGNVDLVVAMAGTTVVLFGYGNGSFRAPVRLDPPTTAGIGATSNRVSLADMDGDGDLDVVTLHAQVGQTGGGVAVWRNDGQGRFSVPFVRSVPFPYYGFGVGGPDLEIGDLNGDGFFDAVVTDSGRGADLAASGGVSVLLGIGDGTLALPVRYLMPPRQSAYGVKLGDLNRDGRPELVMLSVPIDGIKTAAAVFANKGDGTFGSARLLDFGGSALFLATGDFNGDGAADIIIPNPNSNSFSIIFAGDGPVLVTDAPVTVTAMNLNPRVGLAFTATVATFVDDNPFGIASDFTATINWGDGQTSTGTVSDHPLGGFQVTGSHAYASSGTFTTQVTVREIGQGTHRGSAMARVSATDQALTATGLAFDAIEDLPFTGIVATFTDSDSNGSASDFSALVNWGDGLTSTGFIAAKAGGGFNVFGTHTYANPGAFTVIVTVRDIGGSSALANSTAQVALHVNRPPVAINDSYTTKEDSTLSVTVSRGLLANDTDLDGDPLSPVLVAPTTHGILTLSGNGSFIYIPNPNFSGTDRFTYRAYDGSTVGNLATVTITVNSVNDAPLAFNEPATTDEDTAVVVNVLTNDTDLDGTMNPATVAIVAQPLHGSLQVNSVTGAVTYTPALNFFGFDSFRYRVKDNGGLLSNIATVSVFVNPINDVPVAKNDNYFVNEDTRRNVIVAKGLLANDIDIDGDTPTVMLVAGPTHGMLTLNPNGSFTYIPQANYFGSDSFLYRANDGLAFSTPALVSLTIVPVNDAPVVASLGNASLGNVAFPEGSVLTRAGSFSDADPVDSWTATVDYGDGSGVQSLALAGSSFTLNHAFADSGIYLTTVKIVDQDGAIGSATFEVTVQNLAATVNAGSDQSVLEGALVNVAATFLDLGTIDTHTALIDWGDGTGPTSVSITETAGAGVLLASHVYADNGTYVVTLTVTDDEGAVGTDQLTITVGNRPPVINAGPDRTASEGQLLSFVANITDPGSADTHTATINWGDGTPLETAQVRNASSGRSASASHRYADNGIYAVTVTVRDDDGAVASDTLILTVSNVSPLVDSGPDRTVNTADFVVLPVADFFDLFNEDFGTGTISRSIRQAGSFVDPGAFDTHTATIDWGDGTTESVPVTERAFGPNGAPTGVSGVVLARHRYARQGTYTATIRLTDKDGGIGVDSFVVTVLNSGNNSPVAVDDEASTDEDTPLSIDVLANDSFAPDINETLSVTSITQPANGTAAISLNGSVIYTPNLNYFGSDQFSYTLSDGRGGTANATVSVLVNPVNDEATISGSSTGAVTEDALLNQASGALTVSDPDLGENVFQAPVNLQGTYGTFTFIPSSGVWTYTLDNSRSATDALTAGQIVSDTLLVRSLDGTATRSIVITITGQQDSPVDVTSLVTFRYYGAQYNSRTKTYAFYGTITNNSNQTIRGPIELGWSNLVPTTARAIGNTGIWTDGSPYFDFSGFVGSDLILSPGEVSQPRTFAVKVVAPGAYSFTTRVTGVLQTNGGSGEGMDGRAFGLQTSVSLSDYLAPESHIASGSDRTSTHEILVAWGGADEAYGSGITNFDIYVSRDAGPYLLWMQATDLLSAKYTGDNGHVYSFYSLARDHAGNLENAPIEMDMATEILFWPKHNPLAGLDVNSDGRVSPLDALLVINSLNLKGSRSVLSETIGAPYVDTSGDNQVSPLDALLVINQLNRSRKIGEGESTTNGSSRLSFPMFNQAVDSFFDSLEWESLEWESQYLRTFDQPIGTERVPGNLASIERGNLVCYRFDSAKQETKRIQRARTIDLNDQQLGEFDFDSILRRAAE